MATFGIEVLREMKKALDIKTANLTTELTALKNVADISSTLRARGILMILKESMDSAREWTGAILSKVDAGQVAAEMLARDESFHGITEAIIMAEAIIKAVETPSMPVPISRNSLPRLPTLQLPTFDGNPVNFPTFFEAFKVVHEDANLPDASKLTYLSGQLRGRALSAIESFAHVDANYSEAIELLKTKYGNKDVIINTFLDNIINLKAPTRDYTSFDKFVSAVESNCRQLKAIDSTLCHDSRYLLARLIELKLPGTYKEHLDRSHNKGRWQLDDLRSELQTELSHLERSRFNTVMNKGSTIEKPHKTLSRSTVAFATDHTIGVGFKKPRTCPLCFEGHSVFQCIKYKTLRSRKDRMNHLRLCPRCLRRDHVATECTICRPCKRCGDDHHGLFCPTNYATDGKAAYSHAHQYQCDKSDKTVVNNYGSTPRHNVNNSTGDAR